MGTQLYITDYSAFVVINENAGTTSVVAGNPGVEGRRPGLPANSRSLRKQHSTLEPAAHSQ